jgi:hypothetical protein
MHPLDTQDRKHMVQEQEGLGLCNITKCCSEVCPENIHITDNGIIPMKERVVDTKYDPITFLGSKIGMRKEPSRKRVGPVATGGTNPIKHPQETADGGESAAVVAEQTASGQTVSTLRKSALPAASATGAAAGVGVIAWALRRRKTS